MNTVTEDELKTHQKNTGGKRVTADALEANIVSKHWFTALEAARTAPEVIEDETSVQALGLLTICVLVLQNGFTVLGQSACADPSMFNEEIGRRLAETDAKQKIWPLMGYNLKQEIFLDQGDEGDFRKRVQAEERTASDNIAKLTAFIEGNTQFERLPMEEQNDLREQLAAMIEYRGVLARRINRF